MQRYVTLLALLIAPLLHAATFRFDPPAPTNDTTTKLTFSGTRPDGCATPMPDVSIDKEAKRITLTFPHSLLACPAVVVPISATVNLGVLPAGVYDVVAQLAIFDPPYALGSTRFAVRDVTTYTIAPASAPITGGDVITVISKEPFDVEPIHVSLGGNDVPVTRINATSIQFHAPPHAAGPVDLIVESVMGGRHVATAGFTYYDPHAATPDPLLFTSLLFPLDFAGPGAFGSLWTTDNWVEIGAVKSKVPVTGSAAGVVVPVLRTQIVAANSRIRDTSRSSQNAGTEIPVVREDDFTDHLRLLNVPGGKNFRALLRVWTSGEPADRFFFNIDQIPSFAANSVPLQPAPGGLRYGTADLTPFLDSPNEHLDISAGVTAGTRIWGMISITNNDTQQVTIISP
jgi:IPT/TIG domain